MNIHINKSINKQLKNNDVNINIEFYKNVDEIDNIVNYIKEFDTKKFMVYDGYNIIQIEYKDIMYFYSDENYNFCKTREKNYRIKSKFYIYILEFVIGNIIFNFIYAIIKTLTLKSIGATSEFLVENITNSLTETFIFYIIIYMLLLIIQNIYDKSLVNKLNNKLNKLKERG